MTRGPLGDSLYPVVIWRQVMNETPVAASIVDAIRPENLSRPDSRTVPSLCPVIEGSHLTGLPTRVLIARHGSFGSQAREGQLASRPVQAARLFPPVASDLATGYAAPFLSRSSHDGAPP